MNPVAKEGVVVQEHNCRVCERYTYSMSFYVLYILWNQTLDVDTERRQSKNRDGARKYHIDYAGSEKGVKQILWEQVLWKPGMKAKLSSGDNNYPELSANDVLGTCQNFKEERGTMESLIQSSSNIVLFISKGPPSACWCWH